MTWRTEGIFALLHVGEERASKRRSDVIEIFIRVLLNSGRNVFRHAEGIFKEPQRHTHIIGADVHG